MKELEKFGNFKKGQWVRCMPHVVNLAVQQFLNEMKASSKEFRDYQNATKKNELLACEEEDMAFLKVKLFINHLVKMHCCKASFFSTKTCCI
jgi:hypothetical protein